MAPPYEEKMSVVVLAILDDVISKLQAAPASRVYLNPIPADHIDRGLPPIKNMKVPPSIYIELVSTVQPDWHTTNAITIKCNFEIFITVSQGKNYKTSQTELINLAGDVFDTLANLDSTELGGAARLTVSPNIEYGGYATGSAYRRYAIITFSADHAFIVDTG